MASTKKRGWVCKCCGGDMSDKSWDPEFGPYRQCRNCHTRYQIRHRKSEKRDARRRELKATLQSLLIGSAPIEIGTGA